jgi:hypothetical protein
MFHAQFELREEMRTGMAKLQPDLAANADSKVPTTPSARQKSLRFFAGTVLMAGSFLVYPAYPVILLRLPLSASAKAGVSIAVWVLSWGSFSLGAYLAGPEGYQWFKGLWRNLIGNRSRNQSEKKTFSDK